MKTNFFTQEEQGLLAPWVPGARLNKVKVVSSPLVDWVCNFLGTHAITIGHRVFAASTSPIMKYPPGNDERSALLVHEFFHVRQEEKWGVVPFLICYLALWFGLSIVAIVAQRSLSAHKITYFNARHNPFEKPAYAIQEEFKKSQQIVRSFLRE